jgi:predicted nucleic acid-binding protein
VARYLFDTDVLIDYSRRREPGHGLVLEILTRRDDVGICAVQLAEVYSGQEWGERGEFDTFLNNLPCWAITPEVGILAGDYRRTFARLGRAIGTPDAITAAVAWNVGATVVTRNARDYPMSDVDVLVP